MVRQHSKGGKCKKGFYVNEIAVLAFPLIRFPNFITPATHLVVRKSCVSCRYDPFGHSDEVTRPSASAPYVCTGKTLRRAPVGSETTSAAKIGAIGRNEIRKGVGYNCTLMLSSLGTDHPATPACRAPLGFSSNAFCESTGWPICFGKRI